MPVLIAPGISAQTYRSIGEYKLPGSSVAGVAVDAKGRRLYVAGDHGISVLNADTGASLGVIPLDNATDVLLVPAANGAEQDVTKKGYAIGQHELISFSAADLKAVSVTSLPTDGPSSLCYDGEVNTVEAVSSGGSIVTVNAETGKVLQSAKVTTGAGQVACGILAQVYVADTAANVVHVLNHDTGKNEGDLLMTAGHKPSGLALDTKGRRLFVACEDGVIEVVDTDSGFSFIQLKSGGGSARGTFVWTPQGKGQWKAAAFVAGENGSLTAVRMNTYTTYTVGGEYKLTSGLRGIAFDEQTHHLFLTAVHAGAPVIVVAGY